MPRPRRRSCGRRRSSERTTSYLAGLPGYADIRREAEEIIGAASTSYAALHAGRRRVLRAQAPAAQAAAVPRRARRHRGRILRARRRRPERDRLERRDDDRLVRAVAGWTLGRRVAVLARYRGRDAAPVRGVVGRARRRPDPPDHDDGRIARMAWRLGWILVHALPRAGRATAGRPRVLPGGVVPRARDDRGSPRPRRRLRRRTDRGERGVVLARRPLGHGPGPTRRRRRMGGVRPRAG